MSNIMEVYSTAEDVIKNNNVVSDSEVNVPENVQKCRNEEAYNQENYVNVKDIVYNVISQDEEDSNYKVESRSNYKEYSQRNESRVNNECSDENNIITHENGKMENKNDIANNDDIYEKTLSRRILDLIDEDSNEEIISCKKNLETSKTRKIISSESEEDSQTNVENIPQTISKTVDSTVSKQYKLCYLIVLFDYCSCYRQLRYILRCLLFYRSTATRLYWILTVRKMKKKYQEIPVHVMMQTYLRIKILNKNLRRRYL